MKIILETLTKISFKKTLATIKIMFDGPYWGNSEFANLRGYLSNYSYFQMSESEKVLLRNAQYLREDIGQGEVMYTRAAQIVGLSRHLSSFRIIFSESVF